MTELKKCPFCGGEAIMRTIDPHEHRIGNSIIVYDGNTFIECTECSCTIEESTIMGAVRLWNGRVQE